MGGKTWSRDEERLYWREIIPHSDRQLNRDRNNTQLSWPNLALRMHEMMGTEGRRRYSNTNLFEHYHLNVVQRNFSPNARRYVEEYLAELDTQEPSAEEAQPSHARGGKRSSTTAQEQEDNNSSVKKRKSDETGTAPEHEHELQPQSELKPRTEINSRQAEIPVARGGAFQPLSHLNTGFGDVNPIRAQPQMGVFSTFSARPVANATQANNTLPSHERHSVAPLGQQFNVRDAQGQMSYLQQNPGQAAHSQVAYTYAVGPENQFVPRASYGRPAPASLQQMRYGQGTGHFGPPALSFDAHAQPHSHGAVYEYPRPQTLAENEDRNREVMQRFEGNELRLSQDPTVIQRRLGTGFRPVPTPLTLSYFNNVPLSDYNLRPTPTQQRPRQPYYLPVKSSQTDAAALDDSFGQTSRARRSPTAGEPREPLSAQVVHEENIRVTRASATRERAALASHVDTNGGSAPGSGDSTLVAASADETDAHSSEPDSPSGHALSDSSVSGQSLTEEQAFESLHSNEHTPVSHARGPFFLPESWDPANTRFEQERADREAAERNNRRPGMRLMVDFARVPRMVWTATRRPVTQDPEDGIRAPASSPVDRNQVPPLPTFQPRLPSISNLVGTSASAVRSPPDSTTQTEAVSNAPVDAHEAEAREMVSAALALMDLRYSRGNQAHNSGL